MLNDIKDREFDSQHPEKKTRPIASGKVKVLQASIFGIITLILGLSFAFYLNLHFGFICLAYLIMNVFYSLGLKNIALLDVFIIALGFELRIFGGGALAEVPISPWLSIMIFLLALFLGFAKRRSDLDLSEKDGVSRKSVVTYNMSFLNTTLGILASVMIVSYIMYVQSQIVEGPKGQYQIFTSAFVIFWLTQVPSIQSCFK